MTRRLAEPLAALVLALPLGGCGAAEPVSDAGQAEPRTISGAGVHRDDDRGLTVHYPPEWSVAREALTNLVVPRELLALATFPLQGGAKGGGACAIEADLERMPADGALIYLLEYRPLLGDVWADVQRRDFPPRPERFRLSRSELEPLSCAAGLGHTRSFSAADRPLTLSLAFGNDVTDARLRGVEDILDSLELTELPPPPPDPYAGWPLINDNPGDSLRSPPGWAAAAAMFLPPDRKPRPRPLFFTSNRPLDGLPSKLVRHVDRLPGPWPSDAVADDFPRDGVLLWVLEEPAGEASDEFPPIDRDWPSRDGFRPSRPATNPGPELRWLRAGGSFVGYRFSVWIATGLEATAEDRELALESAASLAVSGCWRDRFDDCLDG